MDSNRSALLAEIVNHPRAALRKQASEELESTGTGSKSPRPSGVPSTPLSRAQKNGVALFPVGAGGKASDALKLPERAPAVTEGMGTATAEHSPPEHRSIRPKDGLGAKTDQTELLRMELQMKFAAFKRSVGIS